MERNVLNISIKEFSGKEVLQQKEKSFKREALKIFLSSVFYLKDMFEHFYTGEEINISKARKITRIFMDLISNDESFILGLTSIKNIGAYTLNHSVNVAILSIALGIRLGFEKKDITELGIAGLFHDLGKSNISEEILDKPAPLSKDEFEIIKKHPHWGAEKLLFLRGIKNIPAFALRGILEHHIDYKGTGYPQLDIDKPSLFARILRIVDTYDAMTTSRVYQNSFTPIEAVKFLLSKKGESFDPLLVDKFIEMIGTYPPGTIVKLTTDEIGVFVSDGTVAIIDSERNKEYQTPKEKVKVKKILTQEESKIDPSSVFLRYGLMEG